MIYASVPGDYIDIDGYASALAYAELLNRRGEAAKVFLSGLINYSVPEELRAPELENYDLEIMPSDEFIVLDLSIPEVISKHIPENQITEIIDHHAGFEDYWREKIGEKSVIEKIGAVATNVSERWEEYYSYTEIPTKIAKLLLAAILDNTLNFNAVITTDRDRTAAAKLANIIGTNVETFADWYFSAVSRTVTDDLSKSIKRDHKPFHIPKLGLDIDCAQITLWNGGFVKDKVKDIRVTMGEMSENWLCSIISISDCRNYILTNSAAVGNYLSETLGLAKNDEWFVSDRLWLRKEIFAKLLKDGANA